MLISEDLIEFIGILLGDGGIIYDEKSHHYAFSITLNGIDEADYVVYVENLIESLFGTNISKSWEKDKPSARNDSKAITLNVYSKSIIKELLNLGLKSGNKSSNQVDTPKFIFNQNKYIKRCLKGLVDTDGSIFVNKSRATIYIAFSNSSKPLAENFLKLCSSLDIDSNFYGPYYRQNQETLAVTEEYKVLILKKEDVKKFLDTIQPEKWKDEYRRMFAGITLIGLQDKDKFKKVLDELMETYQLNQFNYTRENAEILRRACERYGYEINDELIEHAIEESFEFKYLTYSKETAEYMKDLAIQLGSFKKVTKHLNKKYKATAINFVKRLFQEEEYAKKYGNDAFDRWVNSNFELLINANENRMQRFSFDIKAMLCQEIYGIIQNNENIGIKMEANEVIPLLTEIINTNDLNGDVVSSNSESKEEDILTEDNLNILKYGRLNYLLSKSYSRNMVTKYFKKLVAFLNEIHNLRTLNCKSNLEDLRKHLRNNCNINWRSKNLKKLLVKLHLYDDLIEEDLSFDQTIPVVETEGTSIDQTFNEKSEVLKTEKGDNRKNVHTSDFQSTPYPYNNHRKEIDEIDFTETYSWLSPQVREQMAEKVESLQQEIREDIIPKEEIPEKYVDKIQNSSSIEEFELRNEEQQLIDVKDQHIVRNILDLDNIELKAENNILDDLNMEIDEDSDIEDTMADIEDQDQSVNDESEKEISSDKEIEAEQEISEEDLSDEPDYAEQEQELSEDELEGEEDLSSDSNWDEDDIYPPLSELNDDREGSDHYDPIPGWILDAINQAINEHSSESETAQEQPDDPRGKDNSDKEEEDSKPSDLNEDAEDAPNDEKSQGDALDEKSNALEEEKDESNDTPDKPTEKIQEEDIADKKSDSDNSNSDDQLSEKENKEEKSDDIEEKEDERPDSNEDKSGINPDDDIYDPINDPINELDPTIPTFQSSSLGGHRNNFDDIIKNNFKDDFDEDKGPTSFDDPDEEPPIKEGVFDDEIDDKIDDCSFDDNFI